MVVEIQREGISEESRVEQLLESVLDSLDVELGKESLVSLSSSDSTSLEHFNVVGISRTLQRKSEICSRLDCINRVSLDSPSVDVSFFLLRVASVDKIQGFIFFLLVNDLSFPDS